MTTINDAKAEKGFKVSGLTQKLGPARTDHSYRYRIRPESKLLGTA